MSRFQLLSDAQWALIEDLLPAPRVSRVGLFKMLAPWWRASSTGIGVGSPGVM